MKSYKVQAPVGNHMVPKDIMTEQELREFAPTLIGDEAVVATWREKAAKDPIEEVIAWMTNAGFTITEYVASKSS